MRKLLTLVLALLLAALPVLAEEAGTAPAAGTEDQISVRGAFAARTAKDIFAAVPEGTGTAVVRMSRSGGEMTLVERVESASDLVAVGEDLYYLRTDAGATTVHRRAADGTLSQVYAFEAGVTPSCLSAYGTDLYLLIDDQLHVIYPANGLCLKLVGAKMGEFAIAGEYAYYISLEDEMEYALDSLKGDTVLTGKGGCLYRLNMNTGNTALLIKAGIEDLRAAGSQLYFHNLSDSYVMGTGDREWLEGRVYRFDLKDQSLKRVLEDYDWGFYPDQNGVSIYSADAVRYYPATGEVRSLYTPQGYLLLAGDDQGLIAYEQGLGKLVLIYTDGTSMDASQGDVSAFSGLTTLSPDATPNGVWDPFAEGATLYSPSPTPLPGTSPDPNATPGTTVTPVPGGVTATPKPTSTGSGSGKDSSYIFPDSSSRKLTQSEVLSLARSMWGYARNEIYARHGYVFKNGKYKDYFSKKSWYHPGGFSENDLNNTEWYNMELIKNLENQFPEGGGTPKPTASPTGGTDSSYLIPDSSSRKLTESDVKKLDSSLWPYARNEIYARHGYVFQNSKYANYFAKKTWYHPGGFSESSLSDIEWYNMDLIKKMENGGSSGGGGGGGSDSSYIFPSSSTKKLTRDQILSISKSMWPYARNEIYARHGYVFQNSKYRNYFSQKSWYHPGGFSESSLNDTEWYNMELIRSMEQEYGVN